MTPLAAEALAALDALVDHLDAGEHRQGQRDMCEAVAGALDTGTHLLVEAGTGVGKSLAYLVPAALSGQRVVVATATKALQDQLVHKDLPFLASALGQPLDVAVLKGRSNYLCLARLHEAVAEGGDDAQLALVPASRLRDDLPAIVEWADETVSGERDDLPVDVPRLLWDALTVGPRECPGARGCSRFESCYAERARERAREAQIVVVNSHLLCLDLALDGSLIGDADAVVVDEAHTLEDTAADVFGLSVGPGRMSWLSAQLRGLLVREAKEVDAVDKAGRALGTALEDLVGQRVDPGGPGVGPVLARVADVLGGVMATLRSLDVGGTMEARKGRLLHAVDTLTTEVQAAAVTAADQVAWVETTGGGGGAPTLRVAPVDVGPLLWQHLFSQRTTVLTSATLSVGGDVGPTAWALGLRGEDAPFRGLRVASPFEYRRQGMLYCPAHLPDPRNDAFLPAAIDELATLVEAAGGRTLALFTSYRAMHAAAEALAERDWAWPVMVQDDASRSELLRRLREDGPACLLATMAFWQGVDIPGDAVRLVVIDKLPFGRPDEPLTLARRETAERSGRSGFEAVDLPRAARLLAQGAGRLIRTASDRGVVAVLDPRLARARYRPAILDSLPPLKRSVDGEEVREFLRSLGADDDDDEIAEPAGVAAL